MVTHIQIGDISPRIQYTGDGVQTVFTHPFPVFTDADIEAYEDAVMKVLATDYTVSGAGNSSGGTVTFTAAPASGAIVTIRRNIAIKRTSDFQVAGKFRAEIINDELDYQTAALQQVEADIVRSLRLGPTDSGTTTLPDKAARSGKYLGFDVNGDPIATNAAGPIGPQGSAGNMSGVNNLSELTALPTARANLGLGSAAVANVAAAGVGDLLRADGDGSVLTGIVSGATVAEKSNIMLNAFRIEVNGGLAVQNMVDGVADVFTDQTGIDTVGSTNETYNAVNKLYTNTGSVISSASGWTVGSSSMTFSADTVGPVTALDGSVYNNTTFTTDTYIQGTLTFTAGTGNEMSMGFFDNAELGTFNSTINYGGLSSMTKAWWIESSGAGAFDVKYGATIVLAGTAITTNDIVKFDRTADTITLLVNGTVRHTFTQLAAGVTTRSMLGIYRTDSSQLWSSVSWLGPALNMTLISNASTALSTPTSAFIVIEEEDVDAVALNTDLKPYASRDGGTTWSVGTLAVGANLTTGRILTATIDISAQPAGTSMKYKVETMNLKSLKIHSAALQWS